MRMLREGSAEATPDLTRILLIEWVRLGIVWLACVLDCVLDLCVGCGELLCFGVVLWIFM